MGWHGTFSGEAQPDAWLELGNSGNRSQGLALLSPPARCPFTVSFLGQGSPIELGYGKKMVPLFQPLYWRTWKRNHSQGLAPEERSSLLWIKDWNHGSQGSRGPNGRRFHGLAVANCS